MNGAAAAARSLISARRYQDAIHMALGGMTSTPDDAELLCLVALARLGLGQFEEALESAGRAIPMAPHSEWPHRLRSIALRRSGHKRECIPPAQEAVRLAPESAITHLTLSDAYLASNEGDQALAEALEGLRLAPDAAYAHDTLGRCLMVLRRFSDAEARFRRAVGIEPDAAMWHNNLGAALQRQGRIVQAIHEFDTAARLDPSPELYRRNVYWGTRFFFVFGVVIVMGALSALIGLVTFLLTSSVLAGAVLAVVFGLGVGFAVLRQMPSARHRLPRTAVAYYESENRRRSWF